jgi:hypothetical protein
MRRRTIQAAARLGSCQEFRQGSPLLPNNSLDYIAKPVFLLTIAMQAHNPACCTAGQPARVQAGQPAAANYSYGHTAKLFHCCLSAYCNACAGAISRPLHGWAAI